MKEKMRDTLHINLNLRHAWHPCNFAAALERAALPSFAVLASSM